MDTSTRLALLFNPFTVRGDELTPSERYIIIKRTLDLVKPQLKYLTGFSPISSFLNYDDHGSRRTDPSIVEFPENLDAETWCVQVSVPLEKVEGDPVEYLGRILPNAIEPTRRHMKLLLLTRDGRFAQWETDETLSRKNKHNWDFDCVAISSRFSWIADHQLQEALSLKVMTDVLRTFSSIVDRTVYHRQDRLRKAELLKNRLDSLKRALGEIDWDPN